MLRIIELLLFALVAIVSGFFNAVLQGQAMSPVERVLAKWHRLEAEKVTLLPLTPVPRPPTIREELHGLRPFLYGGPLMAIVRGNLIYVVDDVKKKLLECSMNGKVLRELGFPKNAPKYLSGVLNLCGNWLWVGFEGPYAFAVDLNSWQIVEERKWKGKGIVSGLFAMPDKTLYVIMPGKRTKRGKVVWKVMKISPEGDQHEQVVEGWIPSYVTSDETIYWVSDEPIDASKTVKLGYSKFGTYVKIFAEIHAEDFGATYINPFSRSILGCINSSILCAFELTIKISEQGDYVSPVALIIISKSKNGQVKLLGLQPLVAMPVRSVNLPELVICEGQVYFIAREDINEYSRFWLMRLKFQ
ncbi:MAG: hypothetical protein RMK94_02625 [Armatimonadota bacterium]|nr:hypothetical protein [Armatimonadota bacterium]